MNETNARAVKVGQLWTLCRGGETITFIVVRPARRRGRWVTYDGSRGWDMNWFEPPDWDKNHTLVSETSS